MKKLQLFMFFILAAVGFSATDTWYVNPDAGGTFDGTTEAKGYQTLEAALAAKAADITGANSVLFLCSATGDTADTTAVTITGWVTDATHTITIKSKYTEDAGPSRRHDGQYGNATGAYKLEVTDDECIDIIEDYVTVEGLQLKAIYSSSASTGIRVPVGIPATNNFIEISRNIIVLDDDSSTNWGIYIADADAIAWIYNNLIYADTAAKTGYGIIISCATADVYNNTVYGPMDARGIRQTAGTVTAYNNIICNTDEDWLGTIGGNYNASDDDAPGANDLTFPTDAQADWTKDFTTPGSVFTLIAGSVCIAANEGSPWTNADDGDVPTDDIVYAARNTGAGTDTSVGCFQSGEGSASIPILRRRRE